ncbi:nitroreductase [Thiomicrorhabdus immobilis]|uniref:Nitroreductase n=1 Tax=Thiomicrorhabdus immobilis TaxID=2791037 RepID=A0ABM7MA76_9GAMM|nr:nitroreductase [Thiomicrorhabdus immobilis]BCN92245.1 nitroreductase [Thiomicrorhabdus immobilis]
MEFNQINTESLLNLIKSRRTCYQFLDKEIYPLDDTKLNNCLQAAIWAPNHKLTQPWQFYVVGEKLKNRLAEVYADNRASKKSQTDTECYAGFYQKALEKFMAIPQVILVGQVLAQDSTVRQEDYAACACAIQNFQLMAWQQKIGVQWSTGPIINDPRTYQNLSIEPSQIQLIGALYLGNIEENCQLKNQSKRKTVEEVTFYLD